jgi:hypothetical protein
LASNGKAVTFSEASTFLGRGHLRVSFTCCDAAAPVTPVDVKLAPAEHLRAAVEFIDSHDLACPSKVLLIYSWNECEEGGALVPSLGDPQGSYLTAIAPVIS